MKWDTKRDYTHNHIISSDKISSSSKMRHHTAAQIMGISSWTNRNSFKYTERIGLGRMYAWMIPESLPDNIQQVGGNICVCLSVYPLSCLCMEAPALCPGAQDEGPEQNGNQRSWWAPWEPCWISHGDQCHHRRTIGHNLIKDDVHVSALGMTSGEYLIRLPLVYYCTCFSGNKARLAHQRKHFLWHNVTRTKEHSRQKTFS